MVLTADVGGSASANESLQPTLVGVLCKSPRGHTNRGHDRQGIVLVLKFGLAAAQTNFVFHGHQSVCRTLGWQSVEL